MALFFLVSRVSLKGMLLQIWNIHEAGPLRKCLSLFKRESLKTRPRKISQLLLVQGFFSCFSLNSSHPSFWQIVSCISVDGGGVFFSFSSVFLKDLKCVRISSSSSFCCSAGKSRLREFSVPSREASYPDSPISKQIFFPYFLFFPVFTATEIGKIDGDTIFHSLIEEF